MRSLLKAFFDTIKLVGLFITLTGLFYFGLRWLDENYDEVHRYDEPEGPAVKVSTPAVSYSEDKPLSVERYFKFLRNGE